MRKFKKHNTDDKFYMPDQIDIGTAEKDATEPTETPRPLAKGFDGMPRFNELQEAQKKSMPKAMRSQVAFQQKKLQWSNYQIINMQIDPTDSTSSQAYFHDTYNDAVAVGSAMDGGVLFGTSTADVTRAKYYNLVYITSRLSISGGSTPALNNPCYVEFYPAQKLDTGDAGGKIPRQIEAVADSTGVQSISITGDVYGVQSFGVDVFNENAYYTQSPDLKGIRCCGVYLKRINLRFDSSIDLNNLKLDVEIGYDLKTEGNNY